MPARNAPSTALSRTSNKEQESVRSALAPAVVQATRILRRLAHAPAPMTVSTVARETAISPSSCFKLLRTLVAERLVIFDTRSKTYALGLGVLEIASSLYARPQAELIRPLLDRLAREQDVLVALWEVTPDERYVLIDRVYVDSAIRVEMRIGQRLPAYAGAIGRCIAAVRQLSVGELRQRFQGLRWQVPISFEAYLEDVRHAQREGYAFDLGKTFDGIHSVGTVATDAAANPRLGIGCLSIGGRRGAEDLAQIGRRLRSIAQEVGSALYGASDKPWWDSADGITPADAGTRSRRSENARRVRLS